jgi:hypothetical protein
MIDLFKQDQTLMTIGDTFVKHGCKVQIPGIKAFLAHLQYGVMKATLNLLDARSCSDAVIISCAFLTFSTFCEIQQFFGHQIRIHGKPNTLQKRPNNQVCGLSLTFKLPLAY